MTNQDDYQSADQALHGQLPDPRSVIERTDWTGLEHAYGVAQDTPLRLQQPLDEDPEVQAGALGLLDMSVLHQESLYSATAPAALYVATVLNNPRTLARHENYSTWDERPRPLRAALLEWLGQIAESAAYGETTDEEDGNDPGVTDAVRAVRGTIHDAVSTHLLAPDPTVRASALSATAALLQSPELASRISGTTQILRRLLTESTDWRERANTVLTIGAWGEDTASWLAVSSPSVPAPPCHRDAPATPTRRERSSALCSNPWSSTPGSSNPLPPTLGPGNRFRISKAVYGTPFCPRASNALPTSRNSCQPPWPPCRSAATSPSPRTGDRCSPQLSLPAMTRMPSSLQLSTVT